MGRSYSTVIFDLDGTLLDTSEGILASVSYTIEKEGLPRLSEAEMLSFIGPPSQESFRRIYDLDESRALELATIFRNRYKEPPDLIKAKPYEGIFELCASLKSTGCRLAVATYKREDYARTLLCHFGFDKYFDFMYGSDFENKLKKLDIIEKCLVDCEVSDRAEAVMIGDSHHDALGAKSVGVDFLGVTYGFGFREAADVEEFPNVGWAARPLELLPLILKK